MPIKLNIYLLYGNFQNNQCLSIKKHAMHIIPMLVGTRATVHRGPALRRHCLHHNLTTWILHFDKKK
jgi:hypothetical protein